MLFHIMNHGFDPAYVLSFLIALTIALTIHEFAHAKAAELAGDPTARENGRVSLNPLDHFDPIGTTMILVAGLGWAKPVPVNPFRFKHPRRDDLLVSLWGPLSNVLIALLFGLLIRFNILPAYHNPLFLTIMSLNLVLAFFNLIPIPPLDGSHVLSALLPTQSARKLDDFYQRWGFVMLIVFLMSPARMIIFIPVDIIMVLVLR